MSSSQNPTDSEQGCRFLQYFSYSYSQACLDLHHFLFLFYRTDSVRLINQYQYPDTQKGDEDAFAREPFVVYFQAPKTGNSNR